MNTAVFEIDKSKKGGQDLYELLKRSAYAKLIKQKKSKEIEYGYTFNDVNELSKEAFFDADSGKTHKSKDLNDLFNQLEI